VPAKIVWSQGHLTLNYKTSLCLNIQASPAVWGGRAEGERIRKMFVFICNGMTVTTGVSAVITGLARLPSMATLPAQIFVFASGTYSGD
jgi:hypothetical protein